MPAYLRESGMPRTLVVILTSLTLSAASPEGGPASPPPDRFDAWVAFADKGPASEAARAAALADVERTFDARALDRRRRRTLPGLVDEQDLPLHAPYLQAVGATGARVRVRSRWMNGVTVLGTRSQLDAVERLPFVTEVTDVHRHVPKGERGGRVPADPDLEPFASLPRSAAGHGRSQGQIAQLGLDRVHGAGFRGAGVRIGVIDTGFLLAHEAFNGPAHPLRVVAQWDFMDDDGVTSPEAGDGARQHEHGTLVLGVLAANLAGILVGSAPEAEYILAKAEDVATEYRLEERWFVAALEFAEAHGADVISSSLVVTGIYPSEAVDGETSVMARGWRRALANGVIGLQGAGNSGHDGDPATHHMAPPSGVPGLITVGAVDQEGRTAVFSSDGFATPEGGKPELLAPGLGVATVSPYDVAGLSRTSGTSMATPLLAGGVACILQARPDLDAAGVRASVMEAGADFRARGRADPHFVRGHGVPDLMRAADPRGPAPQGRR